jgi:hypothetical protein
MAQVPPINRCWAASFFAAWELVPGPQLEQVPSKFNLQTSQLIPQAPVGIAQSFGSKVQGFKVQRFRVSRFRGSGFKIAKILINNLLQFKMPGLRQALMLKCRGRFQFYDQQSFLTFER